MRDPANDNVYLDAELLDLGDDGAAVVTADDDFTEYATMAAAETALRRYRAGFGRRESDGGPLEWPVRSRRFTGRPYDRKGIGA